MSATHEFSGIATPYLYLTLIYGVMRSKLSQHLIRFVAGHNGIPRRVHQYVFFPHDKISAYHHYAIDGVSVARASVIITLIYH